MKWILAFIGQERHPLQRVALGVACLLAGLAAAPVPWSPSRDAGRDSHPEGEAIELDPLPVVGTRLRNLDLEPILPVRSLERADFEASGFARFDDTLRNLPVAAGPANDGIAEGVLFTPGISTVNLRGLGTDAGLVLIDGLRMPVHDGGGGTVTPYNLFSLPSVAIERVEILLDGASAIYGADAVSGVVMLRTIRDFEGTRLGFGVGQAEGTGSGEVQLTFTHGAEIGERGRLVVALETYDRNHLGSREHAFMASTDHRERGGLNWSSSLTYPARLGVEDPSHPLFMQWATYPAPTSDPTLDALEGTAAVYALADGGYNYNAEMDYLGDREIRGSYVHLEYLMGKALKASAEWIHQWTWTRNALAPSPYTILGQTAIPATNPYNPFGVSRADGGEPMDLHFLQGRVVEAGPRLSEAVVEVPRAVARLEGRLPGNGHWQIAGVWSESRSRIEGRRYLRWDRFTELLHGVDLDEDGSIARNEFFNPFGPNDGRLIEAMRTGMQRGGESALRMVDAHATATLLEGTHLGLQGAFGAEARRESLAYRADELSRRGLVLGNFTAEDAQGHRDIAATYAELDGDWNEHLHLQLAGRLENYSDFGTVVTPKVGVGWRPVPAVLVRGSYGEGFSAPSLPALHQPLRSDFLAFPQHTDPKTGANLGSGIWLVEGGNPLLDPADSINRNLGIVLEPPLAPGAKGGAKGGAKNGQRLTLGLNYTSIDYFDLFDLPLLSWMLEHEDELAERYPGQGIRVERAEPAPGATHGSITRVVARMANLGTLRYRGYDLWMEWSIPLEAGGHLSLRADGNLAESAEWDGTEFAGTWFYPRYRWVTTLSWLHGNWTVRCWIRQVAGVPPREESHPASTPHLSTGQATRLNLQVVYAGFDRLQIIVGARNLLDRDPPFDAFSDLGFNPQHPSGKRFWYLRLERWF